ncbi:hypothetical protein M2132_001076 [Dysgonomonas sp. PH5-45]|uniref:hypothetical protein n=1 Tax=unclassified Dysgonomonas TaxID=2630389 RepID=UPI002474D6AD|nr:MULTISPECIES: hypothetical protein [unclassified Dysgonomonas]MDH6354747.1 hypothetical protein [Dysgonomonas sp. PH5-45]MDH6387646.1 hypothetical protein [Dysgonomonas sp. PH5-37]
MKKYTIVSIISFILGGLVFFFVGRSSIDLKNEVSYIPGESTSGSVSDTQLIPVKEEKPEKPILPMKEVEIQYIDTGSVRITTEYIYYEVDTAAIIADYILKRSYDLVAFDNKEQGKLRLFPVVQYNKLSGIDYEFTPVYKNINTTREKVWQPFVSGSYSTLEYLGLGGGIFYHNLGFEYQYNLDLRKKPQIPLQTDPYYQRGNYHWFSGKYKF